ncbi:hypothetical protein T11_9148, partial [Trichinella zimbabwensis]
LSWYEVFASRHIAESCVVRGGCVRLEVVLASQKWKRHTETWEEQGERGIAWG